MPTIDANGISLYYERSGTGPPLLFCNGSGSTIEGSRLLIGLITGFDLVAYDHRGLGRSSVPSDPYTMADSAADAAALLDAVGWDRCLVTGISFGGMVAQELAVTGPERVERLALLCTSAGGAGGSSYPLDELATLPDDERAAKGVRLLDTRFTPEWLAAHPGDRALVAMMAERQLGPASDEQRRGEALQMDARSGHDVSDRLARITAPTLVASGRFDGIAPVENGAFIASHIPDAELRIYEGGHAFVGQDPKAIPDILAFLAGSS